jgi:PAS domain S-box-containing protein
MTKKIKVLVVENETVVALNIQNRLEEIGYGVTAIVSSGEQAIEVAESTQPDLVLMDIKLAGKVDGIQAAEAIRTSLRIPIVYMTAYSDQETLERAKLTEPCGYIIKPFEARELYSAIEIALYKHQVEKQLKEREQWLTTTLTSIGDAVITTDRNGLITFMNPIAESLTGWKQTDALGEEVGQVFRIIDERTLQEQENPIAIALQHGEIVGLDNHTLLIARDGTQIPIDDSAAAIKDETENVTGAVLVFHNIIERKQAEAALQSLNQQLELRVQERTQELNRRQQEYLALIENSPDIIARFDSSLRYLYVNPAVELATGLPAEEFLGKTNRELEMPEDTVILWEKEIQTVFETAQENVIEFSFLTPNGLKYYQSRLVPERITEDRVDSVLSISRDLTTFKQTELALRQSEAQLATITANIPGVVYRFIYHTDGHFSIPYVSAGCRDLIGIEPNEFMQHPERAITRIHPDDRRLFDAKLRENEEIPESGYLEYRIITASKEVKWVRDQIRFSRNDNGDLVLDGVAIDITELKQSQEQLRASLAEKDAQLKEVHTQIKNNLTDISNLVILQAESIQDPIVIEALRQIQEQLQAMAQIHEQLSESS